MPIFTELEGATPLDPNEIEGLVHTHIETRNELNALENANIAEIHTLLKSEKNQIEVSGGNVYHFREGSG